MIGAHVHSNTHDGLCASDHLGNLFSSEHKFRKAAFMAIEEVDTHGRDLGRQPRHLCCDQWVRRSGETHGHHAGQQIIHRDASIGLARNGLKFGDQLSDPLLPKQNTHCFS